MLINNFLRTLQTWKAAGTHPAHLAFSPPGSPTNPLQMTGSFKFLNATFFITHRAFYLHAFMGFDGSYLGQFIFFKTLFVPYFTCV